MKKYISILMSFLLVTMNIYIPGETAFAASDPRQSDQMMKLPESNALYIEAARDRVTFLNSLNSVIQTQASNVGSQLEKSEDIGMSSVVFSDSRINTTTDTNLTIQSTSSYTESVTKTATVSSSSTPTGTTTNTGTATWSKISTAAYGTTNTIATTYTAQAEAYPTKKIYSNGKLAREYIYYQDSGRLKMKRYYNTDTGLVSREDTFYNDSNHRLSTRTLYSSSGKISYKKWFANNSSSRVTRRDYYNDYGIRYKKVLYYSTGRLKEIYQYHSYYGMITSRAQYAVDGQTVMKRFEYEYYAAPSTVVRKFTDTRYNATTGVMEKKTVTLYDSRGLVTQKDFYDASNNKVGTTEEYYTNGQLKKKTIYENGREVKTTEWDDSGKLLQYATFYSNGNMESKEDYMYDTAGKLIKSVKYMYSEQYNRNETGKEENLYNSSGVLIRRLEYDGVQTSGRLLKETTYYTSGVVKEEKDYSNGGGSDWVEHSVKFNVRGSKTNEIWYYSASEKHREIIYDPSFSVSHKKHIERVYTINNQLSKEVIYKSDASREEKNYFDGRLWKTEKYNENNRLLGSEIRTFHSNGSLASLDTTDIDDESGVPTHTVVEYDQNEKKTQETVYSPFAWCSKKVTKYSTQGFKEEELFYTKTDGVEVLSYKDIFDQSGKRTGTVWYDGTKIDREIEYDPGYTSESKISRITTLNSHGVVIKIEEYHSNGNKRSETTFIDSTGSDGTAIYYSNGRKLTNKTCRTEWNEEGSKVSYTKYISNPANYGSERISEKYIYDPGYASSDKLSKKFIYNVLGNLEKVASYASGGWREGCILYLEQGIRWEVTWNKDGEAIDDVFYSQGVTNGVVRDIRDSKFGKILMDYTDRVFPRDVENMERLVGQGSNSKTVDSILNISTGDVMTTEFDKFDADRFYAEDSYNRYTDPEWIETSSAEYNLDGQKMAYTWIEYREGTGEASVKYTEFHHNYASSIGRFVNINGIAYWFEYSTGEYTMCMHEVTYISFVRSDVTRYEYDAQGRINKVFFDENGDHPYRSRQFFYNVDGSVQKTRDYHWVGQTFTDTEERADGSKIISEYSQPGVMTFIKNYDADGNILDEKHYYGSGVLMLAVQHEEDGSRTETYYRSSGKLEKEIEYADENTVSRETLYDLDGTKKKLTFFDSSGAVTEVTTFLSGIKSRTDIYDALGENIVKRVNYDSKGMLATEMYYDAPNHKEYMNTYNSVGELVKIERFASDSMNKLIKCEIYTDGSKVKEENFSSATGIKTDEVEYNETGQAIKGAVCDPHGNMIMRWERSYDDAGDISTYTEYDADMVNKTKEIVYCLHDAELSLEVTLFENGVKKEGTRYFTNGKIESTVTYTQEGLIETRSYYRTVLILVGVTHEEVTHTEFYNTSGNVIKIEYYGYTYRYEGGILHDGKRILRTEYMSDDIDIYEDGVLVRTEHYNAETGKKTGETEYDASGEKTRFTAFDDSENPTVATVYDPDTGRITNKEVIAYESGGISTYTYYAYVSEITTVKRVVTYGNGKAKNFIEHSNGWLNMTGVYYTDGLTLSTTTEYSGNSDQFKKEVITYYSTGTIETKTKYNSFNGKRTAKFCYDADGILVQVYQYDASGQVLTRMSEFDTSGKRISTSFYGPYGKITHSEFFDASGKTMRIEYYRTSDGALTDIDVYENGSFLKKEHYSPGTGNKTGETLYDAYGRKIQTKEFNPSGAMIKSIKYDTGGNITEETAYNAYSGAVTSKKEYSSGKISKEWLYFANGKVSKYTLYWSGTNNMRQVTVYSSNGVRLNLTYYDKYTGKRTYYITYNGLTGKKMTMSQYNSSGYKIKETSYSNLEQKIKETEYNATGEKVKVTEFNGPTGRLKTCAHFKRASVLNGSYTVDENTHTEFYDNAGELERTEYYGYDYSIVNGGLIDGKYIIRTESENDDPPTPADVDIYENGRKVRTDHYDTTTGKKTGETQYDYYGRKNKYRKFDSTGTKVVEETSYNTAGKMTDLTVYNIQTGNVASISYYNPSTGHKSRESLYNQYGNRSAYRHYDSQGRIYRDYVYTYYTSTRYGRVTQSLKSIDMRYYNTYGKVVYTRRIYGSGTPGR